MRRGEVVGNGCRKDGLDSASAMHGEIVQDAPSRGKSMVCVRVVSAGLFVRFKFARATSSDANAQSELDSKVQPTRLLICCRLN